MLTDRQTHRQTDRNTPLPYRGGVQILIKLSPIINTLAVAGLDEGLAGPCSAVLCLWYYVTLCDTVVLHTADSGDCPEQTDTNCLQQASRLML